MKQKKEECEPSDFVKIGGVLGGILLVIILIILIFAKELLVTVMGTLVWGFVVMAIVLGFLQYKSNQKKTK